MLSTMQEGSLTTTRILRNGTGPHGAAHVATWRGDTAHRISYVDLGRRISRLAHALRALGVTDDQRVGTFMWNNAEHLEVYFAAPSMGAVLHTLNIRLTADQVAYIADHAEDHVIVVDASLIPLFQQVLPKLTS